MIKKLKSAIGARVGSPKASDQASVIGSVEQSGSGNAILRIGKMTIKNASTGQGTWVQTEHVALTPDERDELIDVLASQQEYKIIKIGDVVGMDLNVLAVQYVYGGDPKEMVGTVLTYNPHKSEYAVLTASPQGDLNYGTYTFDGQRALNAYITRVNEHLFRKFNKTPPTLTYGHVPDRDKLMEAK